MDSRQIVRADTFEEYFDDIENVMKSWETEHENQLKSLEDSVETGKFRLAALEGSLHVQADNEPENRLTIVTKQSRILNSMFDVFKSMSVRELEAKNDWESQWQEKFSDIRQQHLEMQSALRIKHQGEIKFLNERIRQEMMSIVAKIQENAGIHSPLLLKQIQQKSLKKLVALSHKHAGEKMLLLSKIMQQEELIMSAKNKSIQDKMVQSQLKSKKMFSHLKNSSSKHIRSNKSEMFLSESQKSSFSVLSSSISGFEDMESKESFPLVESPSQSLNQSSTFVTELDSQLFSKQGSITNDALRRVDKDRFRSSRSVEMDDHIVSRLKGLDDRSQKKSIGIGAVNQKQMSEHRNHVESDEGREVGEEKRIPGKEFLPWALPAHETILKGEGKPDWSVHPCKWNPNVIALESSVPKKSGTSPYASFTVADSKLGERGGRVKSRGTVRARSQARPRLRGRGSTSASLASMGAVAGTISSTSSQPAAGSLKAEYSRVKVALPEIVRNGSERQQSTDQNFNRPKQADGVANGSPNPAEKYAKLETWIEDKIRHVLGSGSSTAAILELLPASSVNSTGLHSYEHGSPGYRAGEDKIAAFGDPRRTHSPETNAGAPHKAISSRDDMGSNEVGSFLTRVRSEMDEKTDDATTKDHAANPGLRVESRASAGRSASSLTAAQISQLLNPEPVTTKQVLQADSGDDGGFVDYQGGEDESAEVAERRARFDRVNGTTRSKDAKTPKRVGWNLSPRESEADNASEMATDTLRLSTSAGYDSSRPGTRSSSRPDTSRSTAASSMVGDDESTEEASREDTAGGIGLVITDTVIKEFFSKVRHNKVAECEDQINSGFPMDVRDRHGNTPLLVAAQNGHKRLVKMFLRAGADVNATNHQGNTGLHFTMSYGYQSLANYMLSKGADDTLMNMKGLTCYDGLG